MPFKPGTIFRILPVLVLLFAALYGVRAKRQRRVKSAARSPIPPAPWFPARPFT